MQGDDSFNITPDPIAKLPQELFNNIFQKLPLSARGLMERVNKAWHEKSLKAWRNVPRLDFNDISPDQGAIASKPGRELAAFHNILKKVHKTLPELQMWPRYAEPGLIACSFGLIQEFPLTNLRILKLGNTLIFPEIMEILGTCKQLESLTLEHDQLTPRDLAWRLESALTRNIQHEWPELKKLHLFEVSYGLGALAHLPASLNTLVLQCPHLPFRNNHLSIALSWHERYWPNVTTLGLSDCYSVPVSAWQLVKAFPNLTTLQIARTHFLYDLEALATLPLQELDVSSVRYPEKAMKHLLEPLTAKASRCLPSLKKLILEATLFDPPQVAGLIGVFPHLEHLGLCHTHGLSYSSTEVILHNCTRLKTLCLKACTTVDDRWLQLVGQYCTHLTILDITNCFAVTPGAVLNALQELTTKDRPLSLWLTVQTNHQLHEQINTIVKDKKWPVQIIGPPQVAPPAPAYVPLDLPVLLNCQPPVELPDMHVDDHYSMPPDSDSDGPPGLESDTDEPQFPLSPDA